MAQDRLVNYRHLLSKRGVCCQVLRHEGRLWAPRGRKGGARRGAAGTNAWPCALRLSFLSRPTSIWERLRSGNLPAHLMDVKCTLLHTLVLSGSSSCRDNGPILPPPLHDLLKVTHRAIRQRARSVHLWFWQTNSSISHVMRWSSHVPPLVTSKLHDWHIIKRPNAWRLSKCSNGSSGTAPPNTSR